MPLEEKRLPNLKDVIRQDSFASSTPSRANCAGGALLPPGSTFIQEYIRDSELPWWQLAYKRFKARFRKVCKFVCGSRVFATITTLLTIFALFGDDMRLMFSSKAEDQFFDIITVVAMTMFAIEIMAFCGGKPEYLFGFFFWLDILSTVTLILDVTTISEKAFGDSISKASETDAGGGKGGAGDSAEAARAARMSRAGTKAGRVVRLIRLLRLIKMLKVLKKDDKNQFQSYPGEDWDDDEDSNVQESAVSKKLSEMTTRRVIILVLTIMLSLPFFKPDMFINELDSAGQYGVNVIYRRFRDGLSKYGLPATMADEKKYMGSEERRVYEEILLTYVYKHNPFVKGSDVPDGKSSPTDSFNKLFWLGANPADTVLGRYMMPNVTTYDWNTRWNSAEVDFYTGNIPLQIQDTLTKSWNSSRLCVLNIYRGVSLLSAESDPVYCPEDLRYQERTVVYPQLLTQAEAEEITFIFVFDRRSGSKFEAMLNTFQTLFICLLLGVGSMTFSNDANKLVLAPIERMISKLDRIRNNPLEALKIGDEDAQREQVRAARKSMDPADEDLADVSRCRRCLRRVFPCCKRREEAQVPEPMETQVLERTIIKIGSLLALGFGEAGAQIIGQNMKDNDSSAVMGMIPGRKVEAVYAFCDIRNFTDATEVLQDQVMVFVNRIAAIVHSTADEFFGNPNKNVGDAFLLVWRLSGQPQMKQHRLADMALLSLITITAKINTHAEIAEYRTHPKLVKRLPNYRTRLGFGMHLGWAIEGAIGSEFKIDASYLSPHVNMAARLESDTRYYGCNILITGEFRDSLTEGVRDECRLIDNVDLTGVGPYKIFSMDLDELALEVDLPMEAPTSKGAKFRARWDRQRRKNERWNDDFVMHKLFETDKHIAAMRARYTEEFFCKFKMAYLNYESGNWPIAKTMLEECRFWLSVEDGASAALLRLLSMYDYEAPKSWRGYRPFGVYARPP